ncbi:hypothetical protein Pyn_40001 [Prunus yedoensis var. nudiflora]|uniref:Uncharacterized protein n=1 Tax=Prunus yedoensis var. nudiflora TaxID=2094558 RepID=A0A314Y4D0_PRUYE|nr:hypothetical protein Pyn_40001 [Prunus yedoensis var. nudiflora]
MDSLPQCLHEVGDVGKAKRPNLSCNSKGVESSWTVGNDSHSWKTPKNPSFVPSFIDDGRLEVIGREDWRSDWALLDQVRGIHFEFIEGAKGSAYIIIDGTPSNSGMWHIPTNDLVEIEISYHGQVNILALPDCAAKSIHHSSQSSVSQANAKD